LVVVSVGEDATVRVWDVLAGRGVGEPLTAHAHLVTSVALGASQVDGHLLVVMGSLDHTVRVGDVATQRGAVEPCLGHTDWVTSVALGGTGGGLTHPNTPSDLVVASDSLDGSVRL
jgi:WD40 repeat protein